MDNSNDVHVRSTPDGKLVVLFSLKEGQQAPKGFVTIVGARPPAVTAGPCAAAVLIIGGKSIVGYKVAVRNARVIVWEYKTLEGQLRHDEKVGKLLGGVLSTEDFNEIIKPRRGYLDYQNKETGDWLNWDEAMKVLRNNPQQSAE